MPASFTSTSLKYGMTHVSIFVYSNPQMQPVDRQRLCVDVTINLQRHIGHGERVNGATKGQDQEIGFVGEAADRAGNFLEHRGFDRNSATCDRASNAQCQGQEVV